MHTMEKQRKFSYQLSDLTHHKLHMLSAFKQMTKAAVLSQLIDEAFDSFDASAMHNILKSQVAQDASEAPTSHAYSKARVVQVAHDALASQDAPIKIKKRKPKIFNEKKCGKCENFFTPTSGNQTICKICKVGGGTSGNQLQLKELKTDDLEINSDAKID